MYACSAPQGSRDGPVYLHLASKNAINDKYKSNYGTKTGKQTERSGSFHCLTGPPK